MIRLWLLFATLGFFAGWIPIADAAPARIGFLVVAPDRGFLGNQEVRSLVDEFKKSYPAALGLVGRDYTGVESEYAAYLTRAAQELKQADITEIVAIPLFVSEADPLLKRVIPLLPAYTGGLPVRWAPAMAHDYLIGQIVLNRVEALSEHPQSERLIVVATGEEASKHGRVLVIANRVYGSGPYKKMLQGLTYEINEKGLVDPILTSWLEDGLRRMTAELIPTDSEQRAISNH